MKAIWRVFRVAKHYGTVFQSRGGTVHTGFQVSSSLKFLLVGSEEINKYLIIAGMN